MTSSKEVTRRRCLLVINVTIEQTINLIGINHRIHSSRAWVCEGRSRTFGNNRLLLTPQKLCYEFADDDVDYNAIDEHDHSNLAFDNELYEDLF
jgi:hypothetical protein